ncbi:MAG: hypothetical protein WBD02_01130 [Acidimicrobiia bacterium]
MSVPKRRHASKALGRFATTSAIALALGACTNSITFPDRDGMQASGNVAGPGSCQQMYGSWTVQTSFREDSIEFRVLASCGSLINPLDPNGVWANGSNASLTFDIDTSLPNDVDFQVRMVSAVGGPTASLITPDGVVHCNGTVGSDGAFIILSGFEPVACLGGTGPVRVRATLHLERPVLLDSHAPADGTWSRWFAPPEHVVRFAGGPDPRGDVSDLWASGHTDFIDILSWNVDYSPQRLVLTVQTPRSPVGTKDHQKFGAWEANTTVMWSLTNVRDGLKYSVNVDRVAPRQLVVTRNGVEKCRTGDFSEDGAGRFTISIDPVPCLGGSPELRVDVFVGTKGDHFTLDGYDFASDSAQGNSPWIAAGN